MTCSQVNWFTTSGAVLLLMATMHPLTLVTTTITANTSSSKPLKVPQCKVPEKGAIVPLETMKCLCESIVQNIHNGCIAQGKTKYPNDTDCFSAFHTEECIFRVVCKQCAITVRQFYLDKMNGQLDNLVASDCAEWADQHPALICEPEDNRPVEVWQCDLWMAPLDSSREEQCQNKADQQVNDSTGDQVEKTCKRDYLKYDCMAQHAYHNCTDVQSNIYVQYLNERMDRAEDGCKEWTHFRPMLIGSNDSVVSTVTSPLSANGSTLITIAYMSTTIASNTTTIIIVIGVIILVIVALLIGVFIYCKRCHKSSDLSAADRASRDRKSQNSIVSEYKSPMVDAKSGTSFMPPMESKICAALGDLNDKQVPKISKLKANSSKR